jgi:hypothetical protein
MPRVGFEPMTPVFEREKTVHALDRAATVIGRTSVPSSMYPKDSPRICVKTVFPRCREVSQAAKIVDFVSFSKVAEATDVHRPSGEVSYVDRKLWAKQM